MNITVALTNTSTFATITGPHLALDLREQREAFCYRRGIYGK
jgi:hypothetical protein